MAALTPQYLMDLESNMKVITEREYNRLGEKLWWKSITKSRTSGARHEIIMWLLSTAMIRDQGKGGNIAFEDLVMQYTEVEQEASGAGLKITKAQLEDTDGNGVELSAQWSGDIGAYMSYWPQKQITRLLKTAGTPGLVTGYDKNPFFSKAHPLNPFRISAGTYANEFSGAAAPATDLTPYYPGACPIDDSVDMETAFKNLSKIIAYVSSIRMPNGEDPRHLELEAILCGPRLFPRLVQLTQAKFIAQVAGGGAGSGDVEALVKALGFATPTLAAELAGFEDDKTFFVVAKQIVGTELGAFLYTEREPFHIDYYGPQDQALLGRSREFEWQCHGRNVASSGHPFLIYKCKAA